MRRFIYTLALGLVVCLHATGVHASPPDPGAYQNLLSKYVSNGVVDYQGLKMEVAVLDSYLDILARTDPEQLGRNEQLAFYINAYNAYTIKLILNNFKYGKPLTSIKKIGGFFTKPWSIKFAVLNKTTYTLDNIEHDIIRPRFKDPRVHFAINCAAKSCPPLISQVYSGATLNAQLDKNAAAFINNPKSNYLRGKTLYVSRIFKWFKEDFNDDPVGFFLQYAEGELKRDLRAEKDNITVKYLNYDWSLNNQKL